MNLFLDHVRHSYEMEKLCRLFFPYEKFTQNPSTLTPPYLASKFEERRVVCRLVLGDVDRSLSVPLPENADEKQEETALAQGIYALLSEYCGFSPPWGVLTGIRPGKLYSQLRDSFPSVDALDEYMQNVLLVQTDKVNLLKQTLPAEERAAALSDDRSFSLYVSIPFCPTRCSYCSFVSHSIERTAKLVPEYVEKLCLELAETANITRRLGLQCKTIYFGGGTPTQLSAEQLDTVLTCIEDHFDLSHLLEYTVESGRPDTITRDKLLTLKRHGVGRISINPQTMHDSVLQTIGRRHTAAQVLEAYALAREVGIPHINMDVIAGLPGDTPEGFAQTLDILLKLSPDNITVHTLALKRASSFGEDGFTFPLDSVNAVTQMLHDAEKRLYNNQYLPYYLYRQSKIVGNFENVGWSKNGTDCLYNIYMMNELHTVLAVGAGAVSRLNGPLGEIDRIFNFKYPYEYIGRFDQIIARKQGITDFYNQYYSIPKG